MKAKRSRQLTTAFTYFENRQKVVTNVRIISRNEEISRHITFASCGNLSICIPKASHVQTNQAFLVSWNGLNSPLFCFCVPWSEEWNFWDWFMQLFYEGPESSTIKNASFSRFMKQTLFSILLFLCALKWGEEASDIFFARFRDQKMLRISIENLHTLLCCSRFTPNDFTDGGSSGISI